MTKCKKEKTTAENQQVNSEAQGTETAAESAGQTPETDKMSEENVSEADKTASLGSEAEEWKDKYLRLSAEFDNYRKRTLREKMELIESGGEDVIKSMLAIMDDFERALGAMQSATDVAAVCNQMSRSSIQHCMSICKSNAFLKKYGISNCCIRVPIITPTATYFPYCFIHISPL